MGFIIITKIIHLTDSFLKLVLHIKLELSNLRHWVPTVMIEIFPSIILVIFLKQVKFHCVITCCDRLYIKINIVSLFNCLDVVKVNNCEEVDKYCDA